MTLKYDPRYVEYDADNEVFVMEHYAWDNVHVASERVFGSGNPYGVGPLSFRDPVQAMGLAGYRKVVRSRRASKDVIEGVDYGVFNSPLPKNQSRKSKWTHELVTGKDNTPAVVVPVPLQHAAKLKNKMRVGVLVRVPFADIQIGERDEGVRDLAGRIPFHVNRGDRADSNGLGFLDQVGKRLVEHRGRVPWSSGQQGDTGDPDYQGGLCRSALPRPV